MILISYVTQNFSRKFEHFGELFNILYKNKNKCSPASKSTQLFIAHMYRCRSISSAKFYEYRHHQVFLCLPFRLKKKGQFLSVSFVEKIHYSSPLTILSGNMR
jgi:hypothetical protein